MLRIFAAVAGADSLSAAAEALGVTQSAVSQTISQIETTLGMRVLDRSRRPYRLTPAGVTLQRQSRQIVDDVDRLIAQVREADLMNRPAIRIGMIDSFAATTGPAIVKRLTQSASQVLVWSGLAYGHAQALLNRQVDIIVTTDALEDVDGLARRAILNEPFVLVAPTARADEFARMDLRQLAQTAPFIRFSRRSHFGAMIERHMRRANVTAPPFLEIDTSDVVMAMIAANLGWALTTPLCLLQGRSWLTRWRCCRCRDRAWRARCTRCRGRASSRRWRTRSGSTAGPRWRRRSFRRSTRGCRGWDGGCACIERQDPP